MTSTKIIHARPKFVGYWLLLLTVPLVLATVMLLVQGESAMAGSLAVMSVPLASFSIRCILSSEPDIVEVISLQYARHVYVTCLILAAVFLVFQGWTYALPGLMTAFWFSMRESVVRRYIRFLRGFA